MAQQHPRGATRRARHVDVVRPMIKLIVKAEPMHALMPLKIRQDLGHRTLTVSTNQITCVRLDATVPPIQRDVLFRTRHYLNALLALGLIGSSLRRRSSSSL